MQTVIVTGATGLIGKEVASFLSSKDYKVIKCSKSLGHDLTDEPSVKLWFEENPADVLINLFALNHHIEDSVIDSRKTNLFDISLDSVKEYFTVNVVSLFSVCREFARNNKYGKIINFSSIYGMVSPDPFLYEGRGCKHVGYAVSKCAVRQLSKYLAVHFAPNITVNCVIPGGIINNQSDAFVEKYERKVPLKRMMKVEEINGVLEFLCSKSSSYCTGSEFIIDGGYTLW